MALPGRNFGEGMRGVEWYSGAYGEKGNKSDAILLPNGKVAMTRALNVREGLTVVYTHGPRTWSRRRRL